MSTVSSERSNLFILMIQESIYLEDDKKRISLGDSKSAFTPRYPDPKDFCTFNPAHSLIINENSTPINNL